MPSLIPSADVDVICAQIEAAPGVGRLRTLLGQDADFGPEMIAAILHEASRFADAWLAPLNGVLDRVGCRIEAGRVRTAPGHAEAWAAYASAGWLGLDQPAAVGGQGLPITVLAACQELFDRACIAFGMLPTASRSAARLIATHADPAMQAEWLPRLVSGEWGATICISEADAGSNVGRIRTLATPTGDGDWSITGEKIWISYGDHDLTQRIGHCLLARTPDAPPGAAGLSLFLASDFASGPEGEPMRNAIVVRRIEEKLGLHGSPTCALGFEGARARLIGTQGRGLAQLFTMIATMRLMVAVQGLAVASGAADVAFAYAEERRQGGRADAPAVPIIQHPDVKRQLLAMTSRVEVVRGLILTTAVHADLARLEPEGEGRDDAQALVQWLLPIAKTFGGETAFDVASEAIQVLGGAGYVRDWPVEQALRDSRVFTIFEGTSGIQALDLVHRRLRREEGRGLGVFLRLARQDVSTSPILGEALAGALDLLEDAAARLAERESSDAGAYPFLRLAACAATGWAALRLAGLDDSSPRGGRLSATGRYWLSTLKANAELHHAQILAAPSQQALFEAVRRHP